MKQVQFNIFVILTDGGFNIGKRGWNAYVICSAIEKKVYQAEPGRTEWVTVQSVHW